MALTHVPSAAGVLAELCGELAKVVGTSNVPADRPLVALGLDSLEIFDLLDGVSLRYGVVLPLADVMSPDLTVRDIAALIERSQAVPSPPDLPPHGVGNAPVDPDSYPLSEEQRQSWFVSQRGRDFNRSLNETVILDLRGPVDRAALTAALSQTIARHEALHSVFPPSGERQNVRPIEPLISTVDLRAVAEPQRSAQLAAFARRGAELELELTTGPLYRIEIAVVSEEHVQVALTAHDLVADGGSFQVILEELAALYNAAAGSEAATQLGPPARYRTHVQARRTYAASSEHDIDAAYWRRQYAAGFAPPRLPVPASDVEAGPSEIVEVFSSTLVAAVEARGRALACTPFTLYLAAFAQALHGLTGQQRLTVAVPVRMPLGPRAAEVVGNCVFAVAVDSEQLSGDSLAGYVERIRRRLASAFQHARFPLAELIRSIPEPVGRDALHLPVFNQVPLGRSAEFLGLTARVIPGGRLGAPGEWQTAVRPVDGGVEFVLNLGANSLSQETARALAERMKAALVLLAAAELSTALRPLDPPTDSRRRTATADMTMLDLVSRHVLVTPDATAVIDDEGPLTFAELDARAASLAARLQAAGVGTERVVAVALDRSVDLLVAVLAVWKAGGAILLLNVDDPHARQAQIVADARPVVLVTADCMRARLRPLGLPVILVDDSVSPPDHRIFGPVHPDAVAYVVYTSGSSGKPKGVQGTHAGLLSTYQGWQQLLDLQPGRVHLQMANASFDGFLGEIIRALGSGGCLLICARETMLDPVRLSALMADRQVAIADFVPLVLRRLVAHTVETKSTALGNLAVLIVGSDLVHTAELRTVRELIATDGRVINCYGVTEGTIDSTVADYVWNDEQHSNALIGVPMAGVQARVLNDDLTPVERGEVGVLHLGGAGLSRGYLGDPAKTAAAFRPDPFSSTPGARLYRTGDLVRWCDTPAGWQLEYLGRADAQVKIRGYRVELGEIEAALRKLPGVSDAAAVGAGSAERRHVEAYVVCADDGESDQWFSQLRRHLPHYMLPELLTVVATLPINVNGKVNRDALTGLAGSVVARPTAEAPSDQSAEHPLAAVVQRLSAIWASALHLDVGQVPVDGDFFAIGGDSLLLMRAIGEIAQEWGVDVTVRQFFDHPTVRELAGVISAAPPRPVSRPRSAMRRVERRPLPGTPVLEGSRNAHE